MHGKVHDRHSIAKRCGIQPRAADRRLRLLVEQIEGVKEVPGTNPRQIRFEGDAPRFPAVVAACVASSLGRMFVGSAHEQNMRDARTFLLERLRHRRTLTDVDRKFVFVARGGEHAFPEGAGNLDEAIDAVLDSKWLSFDYVHFDGRRERKRLRPVSVAIHEHQFYILCMLDDGTIRPSRFSRMREVVAEDAPFDYPPKSAYDPVQVFRDSIGIFITDDHEVADVEVRLSKKWVIYANSHKWHPSQNVNADGDGAIVKMRVRLCPELDMWILGFGEDARVLKPLHLRDRIAKRAAALATIYAAKPVLASAKKRRQRPAGTVRGTSHASSPRERSNKQPKR